MDYKHIDELLRRYWQCETSLEEEVELRSFFSEGNVIPSHLEKYRSLFLYQYLEKEETGLTDEFDKRVLALMEPPVMVRARKISLMGRLAPFLKSAAIVAVVLGVGNVLYHSVLTEKAPDYNYDSYTDTYDTPEAAYKQVSTALQVLSEGINKSVGRPDSLEVIKVEKFEKQ